MAAAEIAAVATAIVEATALTTLPNASKLTPASSVSSFVSLSSSPRSSTLSFATPKPVFASSKVALFLANDFSKLISSD